MSDKKPTYEELEKQVAALKRVEESLIKTQAMLRETEKLAKIGGWELDVNTLETTWTDVVYDIHEVDKSHKTNVSNGISFYTPTSRPIIEKAVQNAIKYGDSFDEELEIITAKGNTRFVHAFGKADLENGKVFGTFQDITERKMAEDALRVEQKRIRAILDTVGDPIFVKDNQHRIILANPAFYDIFGLNEDAVLGKTLAEEVPEDERKHFLAVDRDVLDTGIPDLREETLTVRNFTRTIITKKTRFVDSLGERFLVGSIHDITELKNAEELFRSNQAHLSNVLRIAKLGHWEYDVKSEEFTFTDEFYSIYRTSAEKMGGYNMSPARYAELFVHPDDVWMLDEEIRNTLENADPDFSRQVEHRIIYADGEIGHVVVRVNVVMDEKGQTIKIIGANQDITDRKRTEEELRKSHDLLSNIARLVPGVVYQYRLYPDGSSAFPYSSPGMNEIYEYSPEEVQEDATPVFGRLHPDDYDYVSERIMESANTLNTFYCEFRVVLPRQGLRWRWSQAHPEKMEDGSILWHGIISDITERKIAEEERDRLQTQLLQSQKMESIGHLAGGVAHDFNNMLGIIMGSAQLTEFDLKPGSAAYEEMNVIKDTVKRAKDLTSKLLTFARKENLNIQTIDLNALVIETISVLERTTAKTIKMKTKLSEDIIRIPADKNQIYQSVINICNNAVDAMAGKGTLTITTGKEKFEEDVCKIHDWLKPGDYCFIKIRDTGVGVPQENLNQIFDPFYTTKGIGKGTGLGLSVTHGIIKSHGGHLSIESEPGKGTEITIWLPCGQGQSPEVEADDVKITAPGTETVLIIDDEEYILKTTEALLTKQGYITITSSGSEEAIEVYRKNKEKIDIVILDYIMPEMDASDVYEELKKIKPDVKVLIASGFSNEGSIDKILKSGAKGYIQKPFEISELCKAIRDVLDK